MANNSLESNLPDTVSVSEATEVFSQVMGFFRECENTKRETARYDAMAKVLTMEINRKYDLWEKVFTHVFSERHASILKTFEVINKGMQTNDKDMINMGLMGLSTIVASSPFADFDKVINAVSNGQKISI
ncbi:MAG: hypothetical protein FWG66_00725 [Spirochaetes bacterium]|nr:hypothetical protein [Spirochaetota bacterium]